MVKHEAIDSKFKILSNLWHDKEVHKVIATLFLSQSAEATIEGMIDSDKLPQSYAEVRDDYISGIKDCALDMLHDFMVVLEQKVLDEIDDHFEVKLLSVTGNETGIIDAEVEIKRS